jgi:hypothetical protein
MRRALVPAFLALAATSTALAQVQPKVDPDAPSVTTRAEKSTVQLGERLRVYVAVRHPAKMTVNLPSALGLPDTWTEIGDRTTLEETEPSGLAKTTFVLQVAALELGMQTFPSLELGYEIGGELRQVDTEPVSVEVTSVVGKGAEELRPIAQPVRVLERDWRLLWIAGGLVGGGALGAGVWLAWRASRRRRPQAVSAAERARTLPPDDLALERLRALGARLDEEDRRPLYFELTEILRGYLGTRYGFDALELTSEEVRAALARHAAPELVDEVGRWLSACDLVKYAAVPASREEAERAIAEAVALVERTRLRVEPMVAPEAAPAPTATPPGPPAAPSGGT